MPKTYSTLLDGASNNKIFLTRSTASVMELVATVERSGSGGLLLFVLHRRFGVVPGGRGVPLLEKRRHGRGRSIVRVSPDVRWVVVVRRGAGLSVVLLRRRLSVGLRRQVRGRRTIRVHDGRLLFVQLLL